MNRSGIRGGKRKESEIRKQQLTVSGWLLDALD